MKKKGKQKERFPAHIKTKDFYKFYSNLHFREKVGGRININRRSKYYVDQSTYSKVLSALNLKIRDEILYNSYDYKMPFRLGLLGIRKKKLTPYINEEGELVNPLPVNWKATNELWEVDPKAKEEKKLVRHYNEHTYGYTAQWYYSTKKATFKWKSAYRFIPCRTAKTKLAEILKDETNDVDYFLL